MEKQDNIINIKNQIITETETLINETRNLDKLEDEKEKIALHDDIAKHNLDDEILRVTQRVNSILKYIESLINSIESQEQIQVLINILNERFIENNEKIILNKIEPYLNKRLSELGINNLISETKNRIQVIEEGLDIFDQVQEKTDCHVGFATINNKKTELLKILRLIEKYDNLEFKDFHKAILDSQNIDIELLEGINLYSFALSGGFIEIVNQIKKFKEK